MKENNMALPGESSASQRSIGDSSHANFSHTVSKTDPNNTPYQLNLHEKPEILSDPTLDFIRRCLLEEDIDKQVNDGYHERALRDIEKPFYDVLGEKYVPSAEGNRLLSNPSLEHPKIMSSVSNDQVDRAFSENSKQKLSIDNLLATEFHRGAAEGMKFLPNLEKLSIDLSLDQMKKCDDKPSEFRPRQEKEDGLPYRSKDKKSSNDGDLDILEGRHRKIPPLSCEEASRDETFDKALLHYGENYDRNEISSLRTIMKLKENSQNQEQHTNLRALLISCAGAISTDNKRTAGELLKEIRKQACPTGDGIQRLACILADGLQARLAGTGSVIYRQVIMRQVPITDILKAIQMAMRASPVKRVLFHFANKSILNSVGSASEIHVIDFGIYYGLQWPSLIQGLAKREGGPPKLRITAIDVPQPGFRPAQRVEMVRRMLENYARDFGVPFEYQGTVSQWESLCIDDFSIKDGELLIINSTYQYLSAVPDEPLLGMNSPRNKLLKLILEAKPQLFIHRIFNFSSSPFFTTRFKKVLYHYSKIFDNLDTLIPRDNVPRQLIETILYAPPIINLVACEGSDLVDIMETYEQWHRRHLQVGFEQVPPDSSVVKECNRMITNGYKEGFFVEEDCNWILLGCNGTIFHASSLWKPKA